MHSIGFSSYSIPLPFSLEAFLKFAHVMLEKFSHNNLLVTYLCKIHNLILGCFPICIISDIEETDSLKRSLPNYFTNRKYRLGINWTMSSTCKLLIRFYWKYMYVTTVSSGSNWKRRFACLQISLHCLQTLKAKSHSFKLRFWLYPGMQYLWRTWEVRHKNHIPVPSLIFTWWKTASVTRFFQNS